MGDLKRGAKKAVSWVGDRVSEFVEFSKEGSKRLGEYLGYEKAGLSPKSDKTKREIAAATPPVIPMPDEEDLRRQRRRRLAGEAGRSGRAATILSQDDDQLG
jgi:hypothetical protein